MINSKLYVDINLLLIIGLTILAMVFGGAYQWYLGSVAVALLFAFSYILSLNYDIMRLVFGTFEFW